MLFLLRKQRRQSTEGVSVKSDAITKQKETIFNLNEKKIFYKNRYPSPSPAAADANGAGGQLAVALTAQSHCRCRMAFQTA